MSIARTRQTISRVEMAEKPLPSVEVLKQNSAPTPIMKPKSSTMSLSPDSRWTNATAHKRVSPIADDRTLASLATPTAPKTSTETKVSWMAPKRKSTIQQLRAQSMPYIAADETPASSPPELSPSLSLPNSTEHLEELYNARRKLAVTHETRSNLLLNTLRTDKLYSDMVTFINKDKRVILFAPRNVALWGISINRKFLEAHVAIYNSEHNLFESLTGVQGVINREKNTVMLLEDDHKGGTKVGSEFLIIHSDCIQILQGRLITVLFISSPLEKQAKTHEDDSTYISMPSKLPDEVQAFTRSFSLFTESLPYFRAQQLKSVIDGFVKGFKKKPPESEIMGEVLKEFISSFTLSISSHHWWYGATESELSVLKDELRKLVLGKLYKFLLENSDTKERDQALFRHMEKLQQFVAPYHLDIQKEIYNDEVVESAQRAFRSINAYVSPKEKLQSLVIACRTISSHLLLVGSAGADDLFPLIIVTILRACPANFHFNIEYISRFCESNELQGEMMYCYTQVKGAVIFIEDVEAAHLKMEPQQFQRLMDEMSNEEPASMAEKKFPKKQPTFTKPLGPATKLMSLAKTKTLGRKDKYEDGVIQEEPHNQPFPGIRLKTIEIISMGEKTPAQLKEEEERIKLNELAKDLPFLLATASEVKNQQQVSQLLSQYKMIAFQLAKVAGVDISPVVRSSVQAFENEKELSPGSLLSNINTGASNAQLSRVVTTFKHWREARVFGVPLKELLKRPKEGGSVPVVVQKIVEQLCKTGLEVEGIFRISGTSYIIQGLKEAIDTGVPIDFQIVDVHDLVGVLRAFLRELPEPIIPAILIPELLLFDVAGTNPGESLKVLINKLPVESKDLLNYLCSFFAKVASFSEKNKMQASNLSVCFGPNFVYPPEDAPDYLKQAMKLNSAVEKLITLHTVIFN